MDKEKIHIAVVFIGASYCGKSTTIAHLIEKLEGTEREHELGSTLDVSYDKIETPNHLITVVDTPGHSDRIHNLISGISQADCAVLIINSAPGAFEDSQTWEHVLLARTLGVRDLIFCCNKMDETLPPFSELRYKQLVKKLSDIVKKVKFDPAAMAFIPISGLEGDNLIETSNNLSWYTGPNLLEALDMIELERPAEKKPLRLPLQYVKKVDGVGIVISGRVETGRLKPGMLVSFAPAEVRQDLKAEVKSINMHLVPTEEALPGDIVECHVSGVPFKELKRGFVASDYIYERAWEAASFTSMVRIYNQGPDPIGNGFEAILHCHTASVRVRFAQIFSVIDKKTLKDFEMQPRCLKNGDTGIVQMVPTSPVVLEAFSEYPRLGRFVVSDMGKVIAVGSIQSVDKVLPTREQTLQAELLKVEGDIRKLKEKIKLSRDGNKKHDNNLKKLQINSRAELINAQILGLIDEKSKRGSQEFKGTTSRMLQDFVMEKQKLESLSSSSGLKHPPKVLVSLEIELESLKGKRSRLAKELQQERKGKRVNEEEAEVA